jgi:hypothetical protein
LPEGEHWEDAHYPTPVCKGGTETVPLWSRDHAVHGVLQSEDLDYPCLHHINTESDSFLVNEYYPEYSKLLEKWNHRLRSLAGTVGGVVTHSRHPNLHSQVMKRAHEKHPDMAVKNGKRNIKKARESLTGDSLRKAGLATTSQFWMCMVTGKIAAPPHLSNYQKHRQINRGLRVKVDDLLSQQLPIILAGI